MPDHVVFTLVAPIAAFGDLAGHERRGSYGWPGRSAILGLLGAAMGIRRDDTESQAALGAWRTAVAVLAPGTPLRDFHTAQTVPTAKAKRPDSRRMALAMAGQEVNTVVTRRDYRTDGVFSVAIWGGSDPSAVVEALRRPRLVLYLGRKACPLSAPMAPKQIEADDPLAALRTAEIPPFWRKRVPDPSRPLLVASDEPIEGARQETRWDDPIDRGAWHFASRTVHVLAPEAEG